MGAGELVAARKDLLRAAPTILAGPDARARETLRRQLAYACLLAGRFGAARRWLDQEEPREFLATVVEGFRNDVRATCIGLRSPEILERLAARLAAIEIRQRSGLPNRASWHLRKLNSLRQLLEKDMAPREKTLFRAGVVMPALRRLESRLERRLVTSDSSETLGTIADILANLNESSSLLDALDDIVASILDLTPAVRAFVVRIGEDDDYEVLARAEKHRSSSDTLELSTLVLKRCRASKRSMMIADAGTDDEFGFAASVRAMGLRSIACFPLLTTDEGFHALYLDTPLQSNAFGKESLTAISILSDIASAAFSLAHRAESSDRKRALMADSESRARQALVSQSQELNRVRHRAGFGRLVGKSPLLRRANEKLTKAGRSELSILITGETGSGKELAAESIHAASSRSQKGFLTINCATLSDSLAESELFGHRAGAFTGASSDSPGLLRCADGGTLFLDEVGELTKALQAKLLRVLETQIIRPIGGDEEEKVDVRFVFATNKGIKNSPEFREDLYYRISQIEVELPPLRERIEDIPLLVSHFLALNGRGDISFEEAAMEAMAEYAWPGNIRELRNVVDRLSLLVTSRVILLTDLPAEICNYRGSQPQTLAETEFAAIKQALHFCGGEKKAAAKVLGISRTALYEKLKRFGP